MKGVCSIQNAINLNYGGRRPSWWGQAPFWWGQVPLVVGGQVPLGVGSFNHFTPKFHIWGTFWPKRGAISKQQVPFYR